MLRFSLLAVVALSAAAVQLAGCQGTTPNVDDPVVGPPPPRVNLPATPSGPSGVQTADVSGDPFADAISEAASEAAGADRSEWTELVARVDGNPLFASEVLERYRGGLDGLLRQHGRAVFEQVKREKMLEELPSHIEQAMLNQKLREKFGNEAVTQVEGQLDGLFADRIVELKQRTGTKTLRDLEDFLHTQGTSIAAQKRSFNNQQMAAFYLSQTLDQVPEVKRVDIVRRYNDTVGDYTSPADVKWQQLSISYAGNGGRGGALAKLEQAVADLQANESFDLVVGRHSDGIMKDRAGIWDYVARGGLADKSLEDTLFTLPVGEISPPISTDKAFLLVRVVDRRQPRTTPLADVQDEIRVTIERERREAAGKKLISELWADANIETIFDDDSDWQAVVSDRLAAVTADSGGSVRLQSPN